MATCALFVTAALLFASHAFSFKKMTLSRLREEAVRAPLGDEEAANCDLTAEFESEVLRTVDMSAFGEADDEDTTSDLHDLPFAMLADISAPLAGTTDAAKIIRTKPVQWVHIHKSGGTFMCVMARLAGETVVSPSSNCNWERYDTARDGSGHPGRAPKCQARKKYLQKKQMTWGQIERELYAKKDFCHDDFEYGVMLRDPVGRMLSKLNRQKHLTVESLMSTLTTLVQRSTKDSDASHHAQWKDFDNFALRTIVPGAMDAPAGGIGMEHVEEAKAILANFTYVQRLEDLPETAPALFERLGWPSKMKSYIGQKRNENHNDKQKTFADADLAWLLQLHEPELALYAWAESRQL